MQTHDTTGDDGPVRGDRPPAAGQPEKTVVMNGAGAPPTMVARVRLRDITNHELRIRREEARILRREDGNVV
jgi:hypothetical protein